MVFCPVCNNEWADEATTCPICKEELDVDSEHEKDQEWMLLGTVDDKLSADFAREALMSYNIPAVVISKSGYFGEIGLTLNSFYGQGSSLFEISVPSSFAEEASGILEMTVGERWKRKSDRGDKQ